MNKHDLREYERAMDRKFDGQKRSLYDYVQEWNDVHIDEINHLKRKHECMDENIELGVT